MQLFHLLSLEGKVSAYHFYKTLHYRTENSGIEYVHVSFISFYSTFILCLTFYFRTVTMFSPSWLASGGMREW